MHLFLRVGLSTHQVRSRQCRGYRKKRQVQYSRCTMNDFVFISFVMVPADLNDEQYRRIAISSDCLCKMIVVTLLFRTTCVTIVRPRPMSRPSPARVEVSACPSLKFFSTFRNAPDGTIRRRLGIHWVTILADDTRVYTDINCIRSSTDPGNPD